MRRNNTKTQNIQTRKKNIQNKKTNMKRIIKNIKRVIRTQQTAKDTKQIINRQHTIQQHTYKLCNYKSIHSLHQRTSLLFTPHFSLLSTLRRFITTLQIPSLHLAYNYFPTPLSKNMDLQEKVPSASAGRCEEIRNRTTMYDK